MAREEDPHDITPVIAAHVLWHYGYDVSEPGEGPKTLMRAISHMDRRRRNKCRRAFSAYVAAMDLASQVGGIDALQGIAGTCSYDVTGPDFLFECAQHAYSLEKRVRHSPLGDAEKTQILSHLEAAEKAMDAARYRLLGW